MMKKILALLLALCLLPAGCASVQPEAERTDEPIIEETVAAEETTEEPTEEDQPVVGKTVMPLPDTTMENLTDATLAVSLEQGGAYVDEEGIMWMDVAIYTYDKYDMVDIAMLEAGDILVGYAGEVEVTSIERNEAGTVMINGGLEEGGFDLGTEDNGIFFETGYNNAKNWYEVGTQTLRISSDMIGSDNADPELGEVTFDSEDLLNDAIENFHFTPHNTTVRVQDGQIVEMNRRYVP